jgi:hypothetical protein
MENAPIRTGVFIHENKLFVFVYHIQCDGVKVQIAYDDKIKVLTTPTGIGTSLIFDELGAVDEIRYVDIYVDRELSISYDLHDEADINRVRNYTTFTLHK